MQNGTDNGTVPRTRTIEVQRERFTHMPALQYKLGQYLNKVDKRVSIKIVHTIVDASRYKQEKNQNP